MSVDRRRFLEIAAITAAAGSISGFGAAPQEKTKGDTLNPSGIKMAGIRMIPVVGGKYKVWTKKVGDGKVKILLLHGGPGFPHAYFEAFESFLPQAGMEFYYYDQLGCGNSDAPDDRSLWTLPRFTQEVEEVRQGLGLDDFVLYGHSWGGILAIEYALTYQRHLRGLVISNMAASTAAALRHLNELKARLLTPQKQTRLDALEAKGAQDTPEYTSIVEGELYPQVICRLQPWPEPVTRSLEHGNQVIYNQMQGKSEFEITGSLKGWDRWDRLHEIKVKTLTIGAQWDEMDPADMKKMAGLVAHGSYAYCPKGSHLCFWDDQEAYFRQLIGFLRTV